MKSPRQNYCRNNKQKVNLIVVLTLMCAAGIGCATGHQEPARNRVQQDKMEGAFQWSMLIDILKMLMDWMVDVDLTPEQQKQLQVDLENVLRNGQEPEEGWRRWVENWAEHNA